MVSKHKLQLLLRYCKKGIVIKYSTLELLKNTCSKYRCWFDIGGIVDRITQLCFSRLLCFLAFCKTSCYLSRQKLRHWNSLANQINEINKPDLNHPFWKWRNLIGLILWQLNPACLLATSERVQALYDTFDNMTNMENDTKNGNSNLKD